jgi:hypothetical protein
MSELDVMRRVFGTAPTDFWMRKDAKGRDAEFRERAKDLVGIKETQVQLPNPMNAEQLRDLALRGTAIAKYFVC